MTFFWSSFDLYYFIGFYYGPLLFYLLVYLIYWFFTLLSTHLDFKHGKKSIKQTNNIPFYACSGNKP